MEPGIEAAHHLVLGGEKSGKSDHALRLLADGPGPRLLIATGQALDAGFRDRIMRHRVERGPDIPVREVALELPEALSEAADAYATVLAEGLDYWLYACTMAGRVEERIDALLAALADMDGTRVLLVSCESGLGPVAATSETRAFVRGMGTLNRRLAAVCADVSLIVAGRALRLPEN